MTARLGRLLVVLALAATGGCRERPAPAAAPASPPAASPASADGPLGSFLPAAPAPFLAGPVVAGAGFVRRVYTHGAIRVEVTLAARAMPGEQYEQWVRSSADYPRVALDLPEGAGAGFYTCSGSGEQQSCDAHIQLRSGFHVEIMGSGTATRANLGEILRALPLRRLAAAG